MEYHSMYEELAIFELSIWLGLSAWFANAIPVIGGGGRPIDGGDASGMDSVYWVMEKRYGGLLSESVSARLRV